MEQLGLQAVGKLLCHVDPVIELTLQDKSL